MSNMEKLSSRLGRFIILCKVTGEHISDITINPRNDRSLAPSGYIIHADT